MAFKWQPMHKGLCDSDGKESAPMREIQVQLLTVGVLVFETKQCEKYVYSFCISLIHPEISFPRKQKKNILFIDLLVWLGVDTGAVSIISMVKS